MKHTIRNGVLAVLGTLTLAACGDLPTTPAISADDALFSKNGTAPAEHVLVGGSVTFVTGGGEPQPILVAAGETLHPQGHGYCLEDGAWVNTQGNNQQPSAAPHTHCIAGYTEGVITLEVTFGGEAATWSNSGKNENLNFKDLSDTFGHYNGNLDVTKGQGSLSGSDDLGGSWSLDLAQLSGPGNTLVRAGTAVQVCNTDYGCTELVISW